MKLRQKTILTTTLSLFIILMVLYSIAYIVMLEGFYGDEKESVKRDLTEICRNLKEEIAAVSLRNADWSSWDETYSFAKTRDKHFIETNLSESTFSKLLKINVFLVYDLSGNLIYSKGFDLGSERFDSVPESLTGLIALKHNLFRHKDAKSHVEGLLSLPEGPIIISSRPILTSQGKGPIAGTLVYGFYVDSSKIKKLEKEYQKSIDFEKYKYSSLPPDFKTAGMNISHDQPIYINPINRDSIAGYTVLKNLFGKPSYILKVTGTRDIYTRGLASLSYFFMLIVIVGLISAVIIIGILERTMLKRLIWLNEQVSAIREMNGEIKYITDDGTDEIASLSNGINDMLERLRFSRKNFEKSEEKYKELVENLNVGVFKCSEDKDPGFTQVNPAFMKILGFETLDECRYSSFANLFENRKKGEKFLEKVIKSKTVCSVEAKMKKKNGEFVWISCEALAKYDENGEIKWVGGIIEDVTKFKEIENMLSDKNRELNDFTYVVSHDMKSPLNILKGFLTFMKQDPSLFDQYYEKVVSQSDYLISFVDNLLNLSKAGRVIGEKSKFNVEEVISGTFAVIKPENIKAELVLKSKGTELEGDLFRLQQVFTNLIQNAFEHRDTRKNKVIIEFESIKTREGITLCIRDNGVGINGEMTDKIFKPGYTLRKNKGTGFGLAIAQKIVEAHSGIIWVESGGENEGSKFVMKFPQDSHLN